MRWPALLGVPYLTIFSTYAKYIFMRLICAVLLIAVTAGANEQMLGWVSDAACGAKHTKPGGEGCVRKCIQGGEHINPEWKAQKMVLVSDADSELWIVENPSSLAGFEGKRVRVSAEIHQNPRSILIRSAEIVKEATK
jgi:hypothetical protein